MFLFLLFLCILARNKTIHFFCNKDALIKIYLQQTSIKIKYKYKFFLFLMFNLFCSFISAKSLFNFLSLDQNSFWSSLSFSAIFNHVSSIYFAEISRLRYLFLCFLSSVVFFFFFFFLFKIFITFKFFLKNSYP